MKRTQLLLASLILASFATTAQAQENALTFSGGYAFANVEDSDTSVDGWRINLLYELLYKGSPLAHGLSVGYIDTSGEYSSALQTSKYAIWTVPVYYAPKYSFGGERVKGFLKGAIGVQFSGYTRTGTLAKVDTNDWGFYLGASGGVTFNVTEKIFVNAEYEWAYLTNSYYRDGFMNSAMAGIGARF
jgi:opacity protein-like surface antigen